MRKIVLILLVVAFCITAYGYQSVTSYRRGDEPMHITQRRWELHDQRKERMVEKRELRRKAIADRADAYKARRASKFQTVKEVLLLKRVKELEKQVGLLIKRVERLEKND